jgi:hypothetical protein
MYMRTRRADGEWTDSGVVNHANDSEHDGLHTLFDSTELFYLGDQ